MRTDKWATSSSTQLSTVKLLLLLKNALELNFEALKLTENLNGLPPPRPRTHTLTPSSINTQNKSKLRTDSSWHAFNSMIQVKTLVSETINSAEN